MNSTENPDKQSLKEKQNQNQKQTPHHKVHLKNYCNELCIFFNNHDGNEQGFLGSSENGKSAEPLSSGFTRPFISFLSPEVRRSWLVYQPSAAPSSELASQQTSVSIY